MHVVQQQHCSCFKAAGWAEGWELPPRWAAAQAVAEALAVAVAVGAAAAGEVWFKGRSRAQAPFHQSVKTLLPNTNLLQPTPEDPRVQAPHKTTRTATGAAAGWLTCTLKIRCAAGPLHGGQEVPGRGQQALHGAAGGLAITDALKRLSSAI